jgi:hypothetical protein
VSNTTDKLLSPVCECSKATPPLFADSAEPEPAEPAEPAPPLAPPPPLLLPPPTPPVPPPEEGFPVVFEPAEPTIEPLLIILIVTPFDQPVSVFIAGVELLLPLTVTPELIVSITGVLWSPPALTAAVLIL